MAGVGLVSYSFGWFKENLTKLDKDFSQHVTLN